jgi:hypothetical protein
MDDQDADIRARIAEFVVFEANRHWASTRRVLLLSDLGAPLKQKFGTDYARALGLSLSSFVRSIKDLRVVQHSTKAAKIGIIPGSVEVPPNEDGLFAPLRNQILADIGLSRTSRRLEADFWNAFGRPISPGFRRFVTVPINDDDQVVVQDLQQSEPPPEASIEILPHDLVDVKEIPRSEIAASIWARINSWISRNGLNLDRFRVKLSPEVALARGGLAIPDRASRAAGPQQDVSAMFEALDQHDQARIFVPLDLVMKLLSTRR